jgi:DNA-binding LacI/PurR family transcriptional regulator
MMGLGECRALFEIRRNMLPEKKSAANLKTVADRVGLAPCSVSAVLNNTPAAQAIPQSTKERVFRAAAELNYRPNLWARSLRTKRTRMIAAIASDFGQGPVAQVVAGAQTRLQEMGYLLALGSTDASDSNQLCAQLQQRGIEGVIGMGALVPRQVELPIVLVEFGYGSPSEPLTPTVRFWLMGVGESAAEAIVEQIETGSRVPTITTDPKMQSAAFGALGPAAGLLVRESARERPNPRA